MEGKNGRGIQVCPTLNPRKCQLCGVSSSKFRRECPICHGWIAPECRPIRCWNDNQNHCRLCHAVIGMLRHYRLKSRFHEFYHGSGVSKPRSETPGYLDLSFEIQVDILLYVWPVKEFLWSRFHYTEVMKINAYHYLGSGF